MNHEKWGDLEIVDSGKGGLRQMSQRIQRRFTTSPLHPQRGAFWWVLPALLVTAGLVGWRFRTEMRARYDAKRIVLNVGTLRTGTQLLARARGGELSSDERADLLDAIVQHGYAKQEIVDEVKGYVVLSVVQVQREPTQYAINIKCDADGLCQELRAALVGEPDFLSEQSPVGNPLSLTFAL